METSLNLQYLQAEGGDFCDAQVLNFLKYGFPCNYEGTGSGAIAAQNHKGARDFPEAIQSYLDTEFSHKAVIGPFSKNPFHVPCYINPLNTVPKRDSDARRVIVDLSFPKGRSVNSDIPKDTYIGEIFSLKFPSVDALVELVKKKGPGCALFKRDLRRAYRQLPVDPGDIHLLGYQWDGQFYFDIRLPMGLRSAALCCQRFTNLLAHICRKQSIEVVNYLDDFLSAETWSLAEESFLGLGAVLLQAGAEEAAEKASPPACQMIALGIMFDTVNLTLTITPDRLQEIAQILEDWGERRSASRHDLQVLLGKLQFAACCVRPGRIFVSRLLNFLRQTPESGQVDIPQEAQLDIKWWQLFMPSYNGVSMMPWDGWCKPDSVVASDACLTGCGGCANGEYFACQFPECIASLSLDINALELLSIVVAAKLWGDRWKGKRILLYCDNTTSVNVLNSGAARNVFLQTCLREICLLAAQYEFEIRAQHIAGVRNRQADLCSRMHLSEDYRRSFLESNRTWLLQERKVPDHFFLFSHTW